MAELSASVSAASLVAVFFGTGLLGFVTQARGANSQADACQQWLGSIRALGVYLVVPEIADYEQRREFLRTGNSAAIARLNAFGLNGSAEYLPIGTAAMREAARLWALLRNLHMPTAKPEALDGDAILAAQVIDWCAENGANLSDVAVVTTNVSDLSRFTDAHGIPLRSYTWQEITP